MKYALLSLLLSFSLATSAQFLTVSTIYKADSSYKFPLFQSSKNPALARKINQIIQTDLGANPADKNPFDKVSGEDEFYFDMGANNERVVSLIITGSHTGAGLHVTHQHYNLDCRTGAPIDLEKLFGADGQAKLRKALLKPWKESIKDQIKDEMYVEDYRSCLNEAEKMTEVRIDRFLITNSGISLWTNICLDASIYEYDQVKGPYNFSFEQLLPMLSPYGCALFVEATAASPVQRLLRGTIASKYPISLILLSGSASDTLTGTIVYDRVGQPINLKGTISGNKIILHEVDASGQSLSNIEVSWDGGNLSGSFINLKAKTTMTFAASPVSGG